MSPTILLEDKFTDDASFRITEKMLKKTEREALMSRPTRRPQWRITIRGKTYRLQPEDDYLAGQE